MPMNSEDDQKQSHRETSADRVGMGRRRFTALAGALSIPLVGCAEDGGNATDTDETPTSMSTDSPTATDTRTPTEEPTLTETEEPTPTEEPEPGDSDGRYGTPEDPIASPVGLETVVSGLDQPIDVVFLPESDLIYLVSRPGTIMVYDGDGIRDEPLLDISDQTLTGGERGLLGIEPHPEFADNGRLFVRYSGERREGTPTDYSHTFLLAEFQVDDSQLSADPDSERTIMEIPEPQDNHNAGDLAFGPDGYLYVPVADGGNEFDIGPGHVEDWYEFNEGGNAQNTEENLLGGMVRIDVDSDPTRHSRTDADAPADPPGNGDGYAVPADNPLVDLDGHYDELYAWGLRNPFRMSFDGDRLFVGQVGEHQWESVFLVEKETNCGWNVREGSHCFDATDDYNTPNSCPTKVPDDVRNGEEISDPVLEYLNARNGQLDTDNHLTGVSVVGGYVYRGSAIPELRERYVFGDLAPGGRLFVGTPPGDGGDGWGMNHVELTDEAASKLAQITAFGRDDDGEIYVVDGSGSLFRLVSGS